MAQWQQHSLGECLTLMSGGTPSKARNDFWGGEIPWVSCKDMKTDRIHDAQDHLTALGAQNGTRLVPANTILFVVRGMILAREFPVAMTKRAIAFNQDLKAAKPAPFIDNEFLFQWLRANTYEILGRVDEAGHGTTRIQTDRLLSLPISVPPLPVQRRIAGILSAYDDLIENSQRRIRILEDMARGLYREWFVHFRFPGAEAVPLVESALGAIPKGWEVKRLGDLIAIDKGVSYNGAGLTEDGNPMVNLKNILAGGGFRRDATKPYSGDYRPRHTVKPGDIILANTDLTQAGNVVASAALIPRFSDGRPILISHHLFAVRLSEGLPATFVYHLLLEDGFRGFAKGYAIGTTVLGLPKEGVLNFVFALPSTSLIAIFVKHVAPMHQLIEVLLERIENLRRTRDLLLPRLLSGQISVASAEDGLTDVRISPEPTLAPREATTTARLPDGHKPASKESASEAEVRESEDRPIPIDAIDTSLVLQIIRSLFADGQPRAREDAVRELARAMGYRRTGHRIAEVLEKDLTTAVRRGILDNSVRGMLSLLTRSVQDLDRDFLKTQFLASLEGHQWTDRDDAVRNFARWLGYARTGEVIDATARSLMNGLLREGRIESNGINAIRRVSQSREALQG